MADQFKVAEDRFRSLVARNAVWAPTHKPSPSWPEFPPQIAVAVVSCMDPRIIPEHFFNCGEMELAVIRNAGGRVSDAKRSLYKLVTVGGGGRCGLGCVAVIHHTDCGMMRFDDEHDHEKLRKFAKNTDSLIDQVKLGNFHDLDQSVKDDVAEIKADPILPKDLVVLGYVYDIKSGFLREVV